MWFGALGSVVLLSCAGEVGTDVSAEGVTFKRVEASGAAAKRLLASGGQLIADYGSFQLIDAPREAVEAAPEGVQVRDEYHHIFLNAGTVDTTAQVLQASRATAYEGSGNRLHLVQFKGPIQPRWYQQLEASGVRIVSYIPSNAYLVYGPAQALTGLQQRALAGGEFQWSGAFLDSYKVAPSVNTLDTGAYQVQLVEDPEANADTVSLSKAIARRELKSDSALGYVNLVVHTDRASILELAARPDVVSIHAYVEPKKNDERQDMILSGQLAGATPTGPGYLAFLASKGFTAAQFAASGFGVDVSDSGVDNGTQTPNHFGLYALGNVGGQSRVVYNRLEGTPNSGSTISGCDGHGNLNTHIVAGYSDRTGFPFEDSSGFNFGLGVAPWVKVGSSVVFDPGFFTSPNYENLQSRAYRDGMRISTNSWGSSANTYTSDAQRYDALVRDAQPASAAVPATGAQQMVILFAAGNAGSGANTVGSPGTAKNVITVGASENVQALGGADQCGTTDAEANSAMDIVAFSSRGPTSDGRKKPELVAPGSHVSGGVAQSAAQRAEPPALPNGQALACFDASGVCAGPADNDFFPVGQQWYTTSSGTSHSTPAIAGAAALLRQYFINQGFVPPSPAMTKAFLTNTARYLTGSGANDNLFSNNQGMGLLDLGMSFDGVQRRLRDQEASDTFTASGQTRTFEGFVSEPTKPFRVSLAWTDAPGSTSGSAWRNDLDLTVTIGGNTYRGNVFTGASSVTGGSADVRNNLESVFLPAGQSGPFTVTVTASNINSDGVPYDSNLLDQDFALVVYNACSTAPATLTDVTATATASNEVTLGWTANGADNYRVYRALGAGPYVLIGSTTTPGFVDSTVSGGSAYSYVVRGLLCTEAPDSNVATVTATGACRLPPVFAGVATASNAASSICAATVSWAPATPVCGGTISYNIYRSTSAGFVPGLGNRIATGITGNSFADDLALLEDTSYEYVVRAVESSASSQEEGNTVRRSASPTGVITSPVSYFDDFDGTRPANATSYWIEQVVGGADQLSVVSGCHYQSATTAYRFGANTTTCGGNYSNSQNSRLILGGNGTIAAINGFTVPTGATYADLTFRMYLDLEANYDGMILEYSTTAATGPWTKVGTTVSTTAPYLSAGGYNNTAATLVIGQPAWSGQDLGVNGALRAVTVNAKALAGQKVWFAFRTLTDNIVTREGVYLDEVRYAAAVVASCTTNLPPPGPGVAYRVTGLPASAQAGTVQTATLTAVDSVGQVATGYYGSSTLSVNDPLAIVPPWVNFSEGVASAEVTFGTTGTRTLTARDSETPEITGSGSLNVTAGAPAQLSFLSQPAASIVAGTAFSPAVQVQLRDAFGNPSTGTDPVTLSLLTNPGGGTLTGTLTVAAVGGVATFSDLRLNKVGSGHDLQAQSGTLTGAVSTAFAITPAPPAKLVVTAQPSEVAAGFAIAPAPAVALLDAFDNPTASTQAVTVAIGTNPAGGSLAGALTINAVAGVATFADLSLDKVGTGYTLGFGSGSLPAQASSAFDVTPGTPHHVTIGQQPTDVVSSVAMAPAVTASVRDRFDNLATQYEGPVYASLVAPALAQLDGGAVSAVAGVATFSNLMLDRVGSNYSLDVGFPGVFPAISSTFAVLVGPPARLQFLSQPSSGRAGDLIGPVEVMVTDVGGNLVASASEPVELSISSGTLAGLVSASTVNGVATFADLSVLTTGRGLQLTASPGAGASAPLVPDTSAAIDIAANDPASLVWEQQPSNVVAGSGMGPAVRVSVRDAYGNLTTEASGSLGVTLSSNPGSATLGGQVLADLVGGYATFVGLTVDKVATGYTLDASLGTIAATSSSFDVSPAATARLVFSAQPVSGTAATALNPVVVSAEDAFGNATPAFTGEVQLTLSGNGAGAVLAGTAQQAAVSGQATFVDLSIAKAGTGYGLVAHASGLPTVASSTFDVAPGAAAGLALLDQPENVASGDTLAALRVAVVDSSGNVVPSSVTVDLALASGPSGATVAGTLSRAAVAGVATFNDLSIASAGDGYSLRASSAALAPVTTRAFAVTHGDPASLEIVTEPTDVAAGVAISPAVQVRLRDAAGNTVTAFSGPVTVALDANSTGATLSGDLTVNAVSGTAVFASLSVNRVGSGYTLAVTSGSHPAATSQAFAVSAGAAATLAFTTQPANTSAGASMAAVVVEVRDAFGNLAGGFNGQVRLAVEANAAALGGTTEVTASSGVATFNGLSIAKAGQGFSLVASSTGLSPVTSEAFNVSAGLPGSYELFGVPASVTAGVEATVSVRALDSAGNVSTDYVGSGSVTSSDSAATLPSSVPFVSGVASSVHATFRTAGVHTLTVTDASNPALTATATIVATAYPQPTVNLTSPGHGSEVVIGTEVEISAEGAVATGTTLTSLEILVDGVSIGTGTSSPFTATWSTEGIEKGSTHLITAVIKDAAGNVVNASPVTVTAVERSCGCGATSGAQAFAMFGLAILARMVSRRRRAR